VAQLEVQVRARAPARAAGRAEALAGCDLLADVHAPAGEVRVERDVPAAERDLDQVPVALEAGSAADRDDPPRLRGRDGGRAQDADVDPRVRAAVAERRGHGPLCRPRRPHGRRRRLRDVDVCEREGEEQRQHGGGA
jgi:hypothetical protein